MLSSDFNWLRKEKNCWFGYVNIAKEELIAIKVERFVEQLSQYYLLKK
jgi:hypothetical protein